MGDISTHLSDLCGLGSGDPKRVLGDFTIDFIGVSDKNPFLMGVSDPPPNGVEVMGEVICDPRC